MSLPILSNLGGGTSAGFRPRGFLRELKHWPPPLNKNLIKALGDYLSENPTILYS